MSERQTSIPFARSRASKKHSGKPLSPGQMRHQSLEHNRAVAQEQAQKKNNFVPSEFYMDAMQNMWDKQAFRMGQFRRRGQFKGGIAV